MKHKSIRFFTFIPTFLAILRKNLSFVDPSQVPRFPLSPVFVHSSDVISEALDTKDLNIEFSIYNIPYYR